MQLSDQLKEGTFQSQPTREVLIPKPQGGARQLGILRFMICGATANDWMNGCANGCECAFGNNGRK